MLKKGRIRLPLNLSNEIFCLEDDLRNTYSSPRAAMSAVGEEVYQGPATRVTKAVDDVTCAVTTTPTASVFSSAQSLVDSRYPPQSPLPSSIWRSPTIGQSTVTGTSGERRAYDVRREAAMDTCYWRSHGSGRAAGSGCWVWFSRCGRRESSGPGSTEDSSMGEA